MFEFLGKHDGRDIYFISGGLRSIRADIENLHRYFVCAIFLHKSCWTRIEIKQLLRDLMTRGAAYFLFHGENCEMVHDIADEVQSTISPGRELTYDNVIGTDWFSDSEPEEVLFSALCGSVPGEEYLSEFSSYAVISLGNEIENQGIRFLAKDVESTIKKAVSLIMNR